MTQDGPDAAPGSADGPEGVFGNLPSKRPGSRSPRRRGAKGKDDAVKSEPEAAEPTAAAETPAEPEPVAQAKKPADREPAAGSAAEPEPPQPTEDPIAPQPGIHGVEDLAWAGVAVVAQAATAGIRFTSKALEAARKSIDRP